MEKKETKKETNKKNYHNIEIKVEGKEWTDAVDKAFKERVKKVEVEKEKSGLMLLIRLLKKELKKLK